MRAPFAVPAAALLAGACLSVARPPLAGAHAMETPVTGRRPASFYTEPAIYPDDTCRRERRYVSARPADKLPPRVAGVEVVLARDCRLPEGALFAHLQPAERFDAALAALRRFGALPAAAAGAGALPFGIICRSYQRPDGCPNDARAVLAGLPLHKVFIVDGFTPGSWRFAVMPTGPGQPYWDVLWTEGEGTRPGKVELSWKIPAPF